MLVEETADLNNGGVGALSGRGIPLRVGLVAATLVLVACGLLAADVAVTSILRHTLSNRVDEELLDASRSWAQAPRHVPAQPMEGPNPARPPSNFYVRGIGPDGNIWMAVNDRDAEPALPDRQRRGTRPGHHRLGRRLGHRVARDDGTRSAG